MKEFLTKFLSNGLLILLVITVLYILFLRECKKPPPCPAEDERIVKKSDWQSMIDLANKPAIVRIDTIYMKGKTIYVDNPIPPPEVDPMDTTIIYHDTLLKKDINVWVDFKVRGLLLNRKWGYKPILTIVRIDSIIYVPKLIEVEKPVIRAQNGLYGYGTAGGNMNAFLFGGGLDFITKKETEIGYMYQRFGNLNFHSVKFGGKLKFGK
jgi:hypothetical protein